MDTSTLLLPLLLVVAIAGLSTIGRRVAIASPIFMLATGIAVSYLPGMPRLELEPEVILMILLPPLLYSSGVNMSWLGFRANLRPILLLAIGCVVATAASVALVTHYLLGFPVAVGFVLGAIVSPPDAVAPLAITRNLMLPQRLLTILEGESLVNDATALVVFSFALAAVASGTFSLAEATAEFVLIVVGEIAFGLAVGWVMLRLRHAANDPRPEILLALATPFVAFWPPHGLGGSGVISCVIAGLYVSWNGRRFIRPATRLQGYFFWNLLTWATEALIFLLTGLQAQAIVHGLEGDLAKALAVAAVVCVTVIVIRFVWVFPATYLPRLLIPALRRVDPYPNWRLPFMVSFIGLRGAVSLAAALSIPLMTASGPFPYRDLILFATFAVIVVTLVGQGALLPAMVRLVGLERPGREEFVAHKRAEHAARIAGVEAVLAELERHDGQGLGAGPMATLRRYHGDRKTNFVRTADETAEDPVAEIGTMQLRLIDTERARIAAIYLENRLTDEARRRIERELDLDEARVRHLLSSLGLGRESAD